MLKYIIFGLFLIGCSNSDVTKSGHSKENEEKYLLLKGVNAYSTGQKNEALALYEKVIKINDKNIIATREKALIEGEFGKVEEAKEGFLKVLTIDPNDTIALKNLSYIFFHEKQYNKSLEYLKKIDEKDRDSFDYYILGYVEYKNKNYIVALEYFNRINSAELIKNDEYFNSYIEILEKINKENKKIKLKQNGQSKDESNSIKLAKFYRENLDDSEAAEKVLKEYLSNNQMSEEIINELFILYKEDKSTNKNKLEKIIKLF